MKFLNVKRINKMYSIHIAENTERSFTNSRI